MIGFTTDKTIAKTYINIHSTDDLYIKEVVMNDNDYNIFAIYNEFIEIKRFILNNGEDILITTKKEKILYDANEVLQ
jgi:hypothetical protein